MLARILVVLVIVILGAVAAQEVFRALVPLIPLVIVLAVGLFICAGWIKRRRNHW